MTTQNLISDSFVHHTLITIMSLMVLALPCCRNDGTWRWMRSRRGGGGLTQGRWMKLLSYSTQQIVVVSAVPCSHSSDIEVIAFKLFLLLMLWWWKGVFIRIQSLILYFWIWFSSSLELTRLLRPGPWPWGGSFFAWRGRSRTLHRGGCRSLSFFPTTNLVTGLWAALKGRQPRLVLMLVSKLDR